VVYGVQTGLWSNCLPGRQRRCPPVGSNQVARYSIRARRRTKLLVDGAARLAGWLAGSPTGFKAQPSLRNYWHNPLLYERPSNLKALVFRFGSRMELCVLHHALLGKAREIARRYCTHLELLTLPRHPPCLYMFVSLTAH
jgi:hypothetical protein